MALKSKKNLKKAPRSSTKKPSRSLKKSNSISTKRNRDLPASQGQFEEFRAEMTAQFTSHTLEFRAVRHEMAGMKKSIDARFNKVDARFNEIDARFDRIEARFNEIDARFERMEARIDKLEAKIEALIAVAHQTRIIVEEQNARNKFVLDGFINLHENLEQHKRDTDSRYEELKNLILKVKPPEPSI